MVLIKTKSISPEDSDLILLLLSQNDVRTHLKKQWITDYRHGVNLFFHNCICWICLGLQGQAVFKTKLSFRPHSTDSQTHKKMILQMVDKNSKKGGIKVLSSVEAFEMIMRISFIT